MKRNSALASVAALSGSVLGQEVGDTACAEGLHMIVARGSSEAPGLGWMGTVAGNVSELIPGSTVAAVDYPATFANYTTSEGIGAAGFASLTAKYAARCPGGKIALLGYSQGGQALMDALCGTSETGFVASPDLSAAFASAGMLAANPNLTMAVR